MNLCIKRYKIYPFDKFGPSDLKFPDIRWYEPKKHTFSSPVKTNDVFVSGKVPFKVRNVSDQVHRCWCGGADVVLCVSNGNDVTTQTQRFFLLKRKRCFKFFAGARLIRQFWGTFFFLEFWAFKGATFKKGPGVISQVCLSCWGVTLHAKG